MAKTKISEFSATPGNNTDIDGINLAEGCAPSGINDAIRELMSQLKDFQAGTAGDSFNGPVGTTTAAAGAFTTLSSTGNTTLGDAAGDTVTVNGTATFANANPTLSAGTANGVAYLNGSKVLTTGSALVFDGTNLGLGVTPSAWANARAYQVGIYAAYAQRTAGTSDLSMSWNATITSGNSSGTGYVYRNTGDTASAYEQNGAHRWYTAPSGTAGNAISFTQAMTLDSAGNLGVGTTSPGARIMAYGATGTAISLNNAATGTTAGSGFQLQTGSGGDAYIWNYSNSYIAFATNNTERARITSSGNLLVGLTSNTNTFSARVVLSYDSGTTQWGIGPWVNDGTKFYISANGGSQGVYLNGTAATSWTAWSDERVKADLEPIENAAQKVASLRAVTGRYIEDKSNTRKPFLIAQDVLAVLPEAVDTSNPDRFGLSYTDTIPLLVAAIKELKAEVDNLKATLESK